MSKPEIQKVPVAGERTLPIFEELEEFADRIRVRAYNLFKGRGFDTGHDLDDWLAAEREIGWPAAELVEENDEFEIRIALAGFEPDDVVITATPDEIIVKAAHEEKKPEDDDARVHWSEFRSNVVYRHITLPSPIVVDKVEASLKRGMLRDRGAESRRKGGREEEGQGQKGQIAAQRAARGRSTAPVNSPVSQLPV